MFLYIRTNTSVVVDPENVYQSCLVCLICKFYWCLRFTFTKFPKNLYSKQHPRLLALPTIVPRKSRTYIYRWSSLHPPMWYQRHRYYCSSCSFHLFFVPWCRHLMYWILFHWMILLSMYFHSDNTRLRLTNSFCFYCYLVKIPSSQELICVAILGQV